MTPRLRHICVCEFCTIPKEIQIGLNILRTRLLTDSQNNSVSRNTHSSLFIITSSAHNKDKISDGEVLHDTIKYADQCITCNPIKIENMINIKYDLGFCDKRSEYIILD